MATTPAAPTPTLRCLFVGVALIVLVLLNLFHATTQIAISSFGGTESSNCDDMEAWIHMATNKERQTLRQKINDDNKRLEFVHIPKTGGSSIERVTSQQGLSWGLWYVSSLFYAFPMP